MTREESWQAEGLTLTLLRQITSLGYIVSVFRFPSSLFGKPGFVEMHAVELSSEPPVQRVARLVHGEPGDIEYRCACLLAELVELEHEDR